MGDASEYRDRGFTLIEVLIVMSVMTIIIGALATVFSVIVRTTPTTEVRVDDARSTRGLQTWLSHDTMSTPPFDSRTDEGWIDLDQFERCTTSGTKIVEFRWQEDSHTKRQFAVSYRFENDGVEGRIVRVTCQRDGEPDDGTYTVTSRLNLTAGLDPSLSPSVTLNDDDGDFRIESVTFHLTASGGGVVDIETGSRNPVESFLP